MPITLSGNRTFQQIVLKLNILNAPDQYISGCDTHLKQLKYHCGKKSRCCCCWWWWWWWCVFLFSFFEKKKCPCHIIITIINPLTARVVEAPQMILRPVFSSFPVFHCLLGLGELQSCPFPDVVFPFLPLSALSSSPFHCALQDGFGQS